MGKTHKDQDKKFRIGILCMKQKEPSKRVRLEEFMETDLEDDESDRPNSSHTNHETY